MPPLRVIVADDHPIYREGVARAIAARDGLEVVAQCARGDEALARIRELGPHVAVIDYRMPGLDADGVLDGLGDAATRVLVLSAVTEPADVVAVLERGAAGYLNKDADRQVIVEAVERIAAGGTVLAPEVQAAMVSHVRTQASRPTTLLSPREQEVLEFLAEGLSSPQIADRLIVSPTTIKSHLRNLYEKLGVNDRAAAVAEGMRRGLLR